MNDQPRFRLLLREPNRQDTFYTLDEGEYEIGSAPTCRIRTDETLTAPSEALLKVDQAGVWILDVHQYGVLPAGEGAAPPQWRRLEAYDPVGLRSLQLEVVPATESAASAPSRDADIPADVRAKAEADVRMGIGAYWDFRERLFMRIDEAESEEASVRYQRGAIALWTLLFVAIGTVLLKIDLGGLVVLGVLVLGTAFHVSVAGRAVLTSCGVLLLAPTFTGWELEGIPEWGLASVGTDLFGKTGSAALGSIPTYLYFVLPSFATMGLFSFASGWLIDYGLSTEPDGRYRLRRRIYLSASGLVLIIYILISAPTSRSWSGLTSVILPIALCIVWPWGPSQWVQRLSHPFRSADVWLLLQAAHPRSLRYWGGRLLAAGLVVLPFLCFLNGLSIREHLSQRLDVIRTDSPPNVWFWVTRGRSIQAADFDSETLELYGTAPAAHPNLHALVPSIWRRLSDSQRRNHAYQQAAADVAQLVASQPIADPVHDRPAWVAQDAEVHRLTREMLAPFRLSAQDFVQLVTANRPTPPILLAVEQPPPGSGRGYAEVLWVWPLPERWIERFGTYYHFWSVPLLACIALGFIFLWRRGGESPLARWIGIWLLSQAASAFLTFSVFFMPSIEHSLAMGSHLGALFQDSFAGLTLLGKMMRSTVLSLDLPLCFIWVHACWPTAIGQRWGAWGRHVATIAKVALVALVLLALAWAIEFLLSALPQDIGVLLVRRTHALGILLLIVFGYLLRRSTFWKSEVPHLGCVPVVALITLITSLRGMELALEPRVMNGPMFWCAWTLGIVPIVLFGVLLRRNFLRVAGEQELTYVLMVVLVPCLVVAAETLAHALFRAIPFVREAGAEIVAIAGVAALLPLIHSAMEFIVGWLVMPTLRKLQADIEHVLEVVVATGSEADRRTEVARLFERLGITGYTFYARAEQNVFKRYLHHMTNAPVDTLPVSRALRDFLGRRHHGFVDLQNVPFEWPYFFYQFELYRIEKATRCRYLLPICLGKSVRGLLLLASGPAERDICKQPAAEDLGTLGVAAIHT